MRWLALALVVCAALLSREAAARTEVVGPFFYRAGVAFPPSSAPAEGWTRVADVRDIPAKAGPELWIATELPPGGGSLFLPALYLRYRAFLDGAPIGHDQSDGAGGRAWHLISLPHERGGWLALHLTSQYSKTGLRGDMFIGTAAEHMSAVVRADLGRIVLVVLFLFAGVAGLALAARSPSRAAFVAFGVWGIAAAGWTLFYTGVRDLLVSNPRFWIDVWALSLSALTPCLLVFVRAALPRKSRLVDVALAVNALSATAGVTLLLLRVSPTISNPFLSWHRSLVGVTALILIGVLLVAARAGSIDARILTFGVVVYAATAVRDVLVSLAIIDAVHVITMWGIFAFFCTAAWVLRRRVVEVRERATTLAAEVAVHAREREMMLRDMHDGLGRITTTISMLAEVARRKRGDDRPLDDIEALAREGSEEIRTFMRGLDREQCDWSGLEAHMRASASSILESLGGSYALRAQVAADASPPSPYLFVHLLRVFQEGLTNALKHADAPNVRATLLVAPTAVELVIVNDRVNGSAPAAGVNMGAGLSSMTARARDLGGTLDLDRDDDANIATLSLRIGLPLRYARDDADRNRRG